MLAAADAVLAEDTRVTKTLLAHYGITTPLVTYHEHSNEAVRERMIHRLREGEALALVSDAGTPLVSDPGYKLVQAAIAAGLPVTPIPGPSAMLTALVVSGLPTDRFFFEGFLPAKSGARRTRLAGHRRHPRHADPLRGAASPARDARRRRRGARRAARRRRARADEAVRDGSPRHFAGARRAVRAGGAAEGRDRRPRSARRTAGTPGPEADAALDARIEAALARHSIKDAAALVAAETGLPKREVYARALALARAKDAP